MMKTANLLSIWFLCHFSLIWKLNQNFQEKFLFLFSYNIYINFLSVIKLVLIGLIACGCFLPNIQARNEISWLNAARNPNKTSFALIKQSEMNKIKLKSAFKKAYFCWIWLISAFIPANYSRNQNKNQKNLVFYWLIR